MGDIGLILEGGGMRGAYTAGVLDFFLDENISFPTVIGASAGAGIGSSFVARQRERNYKVLVEYGDHPEYISFKRAIRKRELFGMDFIFDTLPNKLVPFDFHSFSQKESNFIVGTTDMDTGEPAYFSSFERKEDLLRVIRASSSLPFIAPSINYQGRNLMDGGIANPIPIQPSIDVGHKKHVIVLTRNAGHVKKAMKFEWFVKKAYKDFPNFVHALATRHIKYNETMKKIEEMEKNNQVLIIRPNRPLKVGRIENNKEKLHDLYIQGYEEAKSMKEKLISFMELKIPQL